MRKAFTLIEILISVTVLAVISGGALIYLNNFNSREKLVESKSEVVSALKLAQSYAKTRQLPLNSSENELKYVQVQMVGDNLVAGANGIGSTFFAYPIGQKDTLTISIIPEIIYYWSGNGFLSHDTNGTMYVGDESARVVFVSDSGSDEVIIKALGVLE